MPRSRIALAAACAALTLAACGGGPDGDSVAAPSPSPAAPSPTAPAASTDEIAAFITKAEGICADLAATAPAEAPDLTTPEQVQAYTAEFTGNFATAQAEFAKLQFPADDIGQQLRQVLVLEFGERVKELQSAKKELDAAVAAKDSAKFNAAAARIGAVGDAKLDKEGVLASSGLTTCDETIGPNA